MNAQVKPVDLFGQINMGYVVIESNRFREWIEFTQKGLGLHLEVNEPELLVFRIDSHARRLIITKGPAEDVVATGYQVSSQEQLDILLERFRSRRISLVASSAEEAALRGVEYFWRVRGPKDLPIELFVTAEQSDQPLNMLASGFITGDAGMGHMALTSRRPEKTLRFWQEFFDARITDYIEQEISGVTLDVTFLRLNERHHSVAIAATRGVRLNPIRTQIQHLNLQVANLDDVSNAYRRCKDLGYPVAWEMGQHTNDREVSFYIPTPSGFEIELGWNPIVIDEANWKPVHHMAFSIWGHNPKPPTVFHALGHNLNNFGNGIQSLLNPEYSPLD